MIEYSISVLFLLTSGLCVFLFMTAEITKYRRILASFAAILEGCVFILMSYIFLQIDWGGELIKRAISIMPLLGAIFAFLMAYRRFTGKSL
ncbi:hypothetical protein DXT98_01450 [Agrobacterium sp. ICMP 7243]|nr:hypothetical protein DXT98_01450 [Agrobacterium sp. ICMP 7243]